MQVTRGIHTGLGMNFSGFRTLLDNYSLLFLLFKINNNTPVTNLKFLGFL